MNEKLRDEIWQKALTAAEIGNPTAVIRNKLLASFGIEQESKTRQYKSRKVKLAE